ncbi:MAG: prepilin-type N-terminal cleavage/methylation domain-containing protein [Myxococcales bacterium]|nr:prepilin-type N-terminal cleavage/methylation domain-containing protein [Myxococcales bacterium]
MTPGLRPRASGLGRHDRGFSLIEAMVASIIMLIGLLGLAGLQVVGMRANNLGKRMSQASLLAQDLAQNMQIWAYNDTRILPGGPPAPNGARSTLYHLDSSDGTAISKYWDLTSAQRPTAQDNTPLTFDYSDANTGWETVPNAITATNYEGVMSPVDTSLPTAEQTIFTRYWNVFNVDLTSFGSAQGRLVQIVVRWKEPNFGYRTVTTSFFKYDPSQFNGP